MIESKLKIIENNSISSAGEAESLRVIDVFLTYLKAEKATVIFGIPGGLIHPLFEAVENDTCFRLVMSKHEEGAAFMADGYARVSKRLAVCAATAGPGATNLLTGVSCAFADGVPMVVVTGQAASNVMGKGAAQETNREDIDIVAMFRPVTKYSTMVTSPECMAHHLRRALRQALCGRPGPVHLNVPVDLWEKPLAENWYDPATYRAAPLLFDRRNAQRAAEALMKAEFPAILAGSGTDIAGGEDQLLSLAELLPARVATSPRAKGTFPEDHPLSLGVMGIAGHRPARETLLGGRVDVLLSVGASLNETTTINWDHRLRPSSKFIQLDVDPDRIGRNYPVDIPLVGDAQTIMMELVYNVHRGIRQGSEVASKWNREAAPSTKRDRPVIAQGDGGTRLFPLTPRKWREELSQLLPDNAVIFSDIGGHMLFNLHHLTIRRHQRFVLNLGFGSVGHGTVSPIGAAIAVPSRPVVAIVGDGCFTMNGMELLTAREYNLPVIWIVENNNMHGITWFGSQLVGQRKPLRAARYQKPLEIARIAESMGLRAWRVEAPGELPEAFGKAMSSRQPTVIECLVDPEVAPPLGDRARSIAGFIDN